MKIKDSELILNPDGSIYHLHLRPDQVAPLILTVGDQGRVPRVSKYFDAIDFEVQKREFVTHTGWLGGRRISVVSTGIGPDNIDIVFNELDALFNIDFETRQVKFELTALTIIRLGTGASRDDQGARTSENEITRIAVNWILLDYQKHGPRSVLTQLLASLHG